MTPQITNVKQQNVLDSTGRISQGIAVTWKLGNHGPFTLVTNQTELASGAALQKINALAGQILALPGAAVAS